MIKINLPLMAFFIGSLITGCDEESEKVVPSTDEEIPAKVDFVSNQGSIRENSSSGSAITIALSHAISSQGSIQLILQSDNADYGTHFTTVPVAINGIITLPVEPGTEHVVLNVFPVNDELFNGGRLIKYSIENVDGDITKGESLEHELIIGDDELEGTGRGYEIFAGSWSYKKGYVYNENGTLGEIHWEQNTPGHTEGIYRYVYNQEGQLQKIIESTVREKKFLWEGDKIVKAEEYTNNVLTKYIDYGYDIAGNVGEAAVHYRQPNGDLKLTTIFVYLYHTDNNLYKELVYTVVDGVEEHTLLATRTFENYLDVENPFPMVDILPNQKSQHKLPSAYRIEENGHDILYQFSYTFSEEGKPMTRTATSSGGSETAHYSYY